MVCGPEWVKGWFMISISVPEKVPDSTWESKLISPKWAGTQQVLEELAQVKNRAPWNAPLLDLTRLAIFYVKVKLQKIFSIDYGSAK